MSKLIDVLLYSSDLNIGLWLMTQMMIMMKMLRLGVMCDAASIWLQPIGKENKPRCLKGHAIMQALKL